MIAALSVIALILLILWSSLAEAHRKAAQFYDDAVWRVLTDEETDRDE